MAGLQAARLAAEIAGRCFPVLKEPLPVAVTDGYPISSRSLSGAFAALELNSNGRLFALDNKERKDVREKRAGCRSDEGQAPTAFFA
jgi:hypothetical protein